MTDLKERLLARHPTQITFMPTPPDRPTHYTGFASSLAGLINPDGPEAIARITALEAEIAGQAWQPIESAPKDGTLVELWHRTWLVPIAASHWDEFGWTEITKTTRWPEEAFTHWRQRSAPPLKDQPK